MAQESAGKVKVSFEEALIKRVKRMAEESINRTLQTQVSDVARETLKKHIQEDFYDKYSPKVYERRSGVGGLIDDNNIVTEVDGTRITIADIAPPSPSIFGTPITDNDPTLLTKWIDDGEVYTEPFATAGYNGQGQTLDEHFAKPSFFEETYRELVGLDIIEDIVRESLKKDLARGIRYNPKKK